METILFAGIWGIGLFSIFILLFMLNKRTPVPKGCENLHADCSGCKIITCSRSSIKKEKEGE